MKALALTLLLFPTLLAAQVKSKMLTCDCFVQSVIFEANGSPACYEAARIPFTVKFDGKNATLTMRQYNYELRYHTAWVDPSGIRNSTYIKKGEIELHTTYPLARNFVAVFTHPDEKWLTSALCRE